MNRPSSRGYNATAPAPSRRPAAPASNNRNGRGQRQAWTDETSGYDDMFAGGPGGGDENLPDQFNDAYNSTKGARARPQFDPFAVLRKMLYTPPVALEAFCARLAVSSVTSAPRISMGAFQKR